MEWVLALVIGQAMPQLPPPVELRLQTIESNIGELRYMQSVTDQKLSRIEARLNSRGVEGNAPAVGQGTASGSGVGMYSSGSSCVSGECGVSTVRGAYRSREVNKERRGLFKGFKLFKGRKGGC